MVFSIIDLSKSGHLHLGSSKNSRTSDGDLKLAIDDAMNGNYSRCYEIAFHYEALENGGDMVRCAYAVNFLESE